MVKGAVGTFVLRPVFLWVLSPFQEEDLVLHLKIDQFLGRVCVKVQKEKFSVKMDTKRKFGSR